MSRYLYFLIIVIILVLPLISYAEEVTFSGGGDGESWSDEKNWFPEDVPTLSSDVLLDLKDGKITCDKTFKARSITIGGRETTTLTSDNFIYGTVDPGKGSEISILNRIKGTIILKGAGVLVLKGKYKDSEEPLTTEPSFLFWIK